jgi:hypothetical protein
MAIRNVGAAFYLASPWPDDRMEELFQRVGLSFKGPAHPFPEPDRTGCREAWWGPVFGEAGIDRIEGQEVFKILFTANAWVGLYCGYSQGEKQKGLLPLQDLFCQACVSIQPLLGYLSNCASHLQYPEPGENSAMDDIVQKVRERDTEWLTSCGFNTFYLGEALTATPPPRHPSYFEFPAPVGSFYSRSPRLQRVWTERARKVPPP